MEGKSMISHKIISGDTHVVEPPDLYASRMSRKLRARAPYVVVTNL